MTNTTKNLQYEIKQEEALSDYKTAFMSREASLIGRKTVLSGKAKFGIFGDGKELAQIAMAKFFNKGDWRSGYYRDQTFMFAKQIITYKQFFAQLFADTQKGHDPSSAGRQMNSHFATKYIENGKWLDQTKQYNSAADGSPTASQMGRLVGLGYASKLFREQSILQDKDLSLFTDKGNEVAFGTIGNASAAEGLFWESLNAAGVLQIPVVFSIWDDGYGISVPNKFQMTKDSISAACSGFNSDEQTNGVDIHKVKGWDYLALVNTYAEVVNKSRKLHRPCMIHVTELTQPQGHSTSGSHERYKTKSRMDFEIAQDCNLHFRKWLLAQDYISSTRLAQQEKEWALEVKNAHDDAWSEYLSAIENDKNQVTQELQKILEVINQEKDAPKSKELLESTIKQLVATKVTLRRQYVSVLRKLFVNMLSEQSTHLDSVKKIVDSIQKTQIYNYTSFLQQDNHNSLKIDYVAAKYSKDAKKIQGHEILNRFFKNSFKNDKRLFIMGEDIGFLGGVNQVFKDMQEEFGIHRVSDTGIREATILGQGIGTAMRGLKPIVDIQYLDYIYYCLQLIADDLSSLSYRTAGVQAAPCIIRTKGHRLEGIWHSGSPMAAIVNAVRGVNVCVPRNCVQAAGLYNTLFAKNDPAILVEVLNGYRVREKEPSNLMEFKIELGKPEILKTGKDITIVTYGACCTLVMSAAVLLQKLNIDVEVIDVQTLLPFDIYNIIGASVEKTNAILFIDEDVPGGISAYMLEKVLVSQKAYDCLDAPPRTLSAKENRPAYGSDGDYWCKPNVEDIVETVYSTIAERDPQNFPQLEITH